MSLRQIPVIDLFAGPGGLGEGFASLGRLEHRPLFDIKLSIEKDPVAAETLQLRAFFRRFPHGEAPREYYEVLQHKLKKEELFSLYAKAASEAKSEAWCTELGKEDGSEISRRIRNVLHGTEEWVLIGGPPCQAYSNVGRSRNKGVKDYVPEKDPRQFLYVEYLQILADHRPAVFVMENVKGLLSARVNNLRIFSRILDDLQSPSEALRRESRKVRNSRQTRYRIYSLEKSELFVDCNPGDFVIKTELHGIPQSRHRVILLGVREDVPQALPGKLRVQDKVPANSVLLGLPPLRSGISDGADNGDAWKDWLKTAPRLPWFKELRSAGLANVRIFLEHVIDSLTAPKRDRGSEFLPYEANIRHEKDWFLDSKLGGVCNHVTRAHMHADLHRYLFAAAFAKVMNKSPILTDFPHQLLPEHESINNTKEGGGLHFDDRFRVQLGTRPSTTITSHLSKDGHYYIHPDAAQCRSLTVREAARLQTFPDNYLFCGTRTAQYNQVGNAVPPLLAREIARIVSDSLR